MIRDDGIRADGARKQLSASDNVPATVKSGYAKGFDVFAAAVRSPSLKAVLAHWAQARGAQAMPAWEQLSPAHIVRHLPLIWAYRYDQETDAFTGRLAGDKICQIFGKNIRGLSLEEIFPSDAVDWTHRLYSRVVLEPALHHISGRVFSHLRRWGVGERIILPLSSDGVVGDGILGVTDYHYPHRSTAGEPAAETEAEQWFCLRPQRFNADHH